MTKFHPAVSSRLTWELQDMVSVRRKDATAKSGVLEVRRPTLGCITVGTTDLVLVSVGIFQIIGDKQVRRGLEPCHLS